MLLARARAAVRAVNGVLPRLAIIFAAGNERPASLDVSASLLERFESASLELGLRVMLAGVDVTRYLTGSLEISDSIESVIRQGTLTLTGREWMPHSNWSTWTRTPLQIYLTLGPPGQSYELLELDGLVDTADPTGYETKISFADKGLQFATAKPCFSLDPLAGLSRGEIMRRVAEMSGAVLDSPGGGPYTKPVEVTSTELFPWLAAFAAPEGWYLRVDNEGRIETYRADLVPPGTPPAATWLDADLLEQLKIQPPDEVPSRIIVRGNTAVSIDELGFETTIEVSETRAVMTPAPAVSWQNSDGSLTPITVEANYIDRVRSRITKTSTRKGERLLREVELEEGWYNPRTSLLTTGSAGGGLGLGPAEEGYYYVTTYIDGDGQAVALRQQQFFPLHRIETDYTYDEETGTLLSQVTRTYAWYTRRGGVRSASSEGPSVVGVGIGDDGASYLPIAGIWGIEAFGLFHEARAEYTYDEASGAATKQTVTESSYLAPRASIDTFTTNFVNADGYGMFGAFANWRTIRRTDRSTTVDSSGRVSLEVDTITEWWAPTGPRGSYDWGQEERGPWKTERFRYRESNRRSYRILNSTSYEVAAVEKGTAQPTEIRQGAPPVPAYLGSPWRQLVQSPAEVLFDDPELAELLGERITVLNSPYLETEEEAVRLAWRLLDAEFAHDITLKRRLSWIRPGDTVLLNDPQTGFVGRAVVQDRKRSISLNPPAALAEYRLRQPLASGAR